MVNADPESNRFFFLSMCIEVVFRFAQRVGSESDLQMNADLNPTLQINTDPNPTLQINTDSDPTLQSKFEADPTL